MTKTYKATGINLKGIPIGESDRLLTILTKELGLIRVVAPGARKHQSRLRGRSELFVTNDLLIAKGRSLDKIVQAEGISSCSGLSQDLRKLTAGQYLAELVLFQALSEQPQDELFDAIQSQLKQLHEIPTSATLQALVHATFHLLTLAGVAPRVNACCLTQAQLIPNYADPNWRVGFSAAVGGTVQLNEIKRFARQPTPRQANGQPKEAAEVYRVPDPPSNSKSIKPSITISQLTAIELGLLQQLQQPQLLQPDGELHLSLLEQLPYPPSEQAWLTIERLLRDYAQYHFERPIRSATLINTCFLSKPISC